MPHVILHLSPELQEQNWQPFFAKIHTLLTPYIKSGVSKSRVNVISQVYVDKGEMRTALINLELCLRPRPDEVLKEIGDAVFTALKNEVTPILKAKGLNAEPTMEIRILNHYWQ